MNPFKTIARALSGGDASAFVHVERDLAEKFGLTHDTVKAARAAGLQRGVDWELVRSLVTYSDAGKAKILAALGVPGEPAAAITPPTPNPVPPATDSAANITLPQDPGEKNPETAPVHGEQRDLVCEKRVANRRTVLARTAGGVTAWVRVSDSTNFRPGMMMPCRFLERDQWELARKAPRHPGKW